MQWAYDPWWCCGIYLLEWSWGWRWGLGLKFIPKQVMISHANTLSILCTKIRSDHEYNLSSLPVYEVWNEMRISNMKRQQTVKSIPPIGVEISDCSTREEGMKEWVIRMFWVVQLNGTGNAGGWIALKAPPDTRQVLMLNKCSMWNVVHCACCCIWSWTLNPAA